MPVSFWSTLAAKRSPLTLVAVRKRSTNQSMATTMAYIPVMGMPTEPAMMTVRTNEELGMGVVAMEDSTASSTMTV